MSRRHPLDDEFDVDSPLYDDEISEVEIPENASLRDIADLALKQYKEINDLLIQIEPSHRSKFIELAHKYLKEANDAIDRIEKNKIQYLKAKRQEQGKPDGDEKPKQEGTVSRDELLNRQMKRVK